MLRKEQIEYALHYADDPVEWVFELVRGLENRIDELLKYGTKVTVFQEHWYPASERPIIPKGKCSVNIIAYCITPSGIYTPIEFTYTKVGKWLDSIEWWCYPPKED